MANASDKDGLTALHCAASRGHARCIETLVNLCDAQPDHVDDNGCSALHYAATLGHADATSLLLKLGADPNRQDRKGRTLVCFVRFAYIRDDFIAAYSVQGDSSPTPGRD